ncbi:MAG: hypothetical protein D6690_04735 [Nitrospirae bacterium]|nr:MAG: hypothetical protein D6690_04735 [Nitrospirota bacterium]
MIPKFFLKVGRLIGCAIVLFGWMIAADSIAPRSAGAEPTKPLEKAFPHSEKCKRCHLRVFEEWEASAQSRSILTAPFRISLNRLIEAKGEKGAMMCFRCHAPHILEYPSHLKSFIDEVRSRDPRIDGVGCSQCHLIKDVKTEENPPLPIYALGKTIFGGYADAVENLAHQSEANPLYRRSDYCVTCHHSLPSMDNAQPLPGWLGNWRATKAQKSGKTCQTCHMPEAFGESANGERNRKIANHSFPGRFGKVRAKALEVDFETEVTGNTSHVTVTLRSLVPHHLPVPHPGWSRMVLDLTILGKNLKKVYGEQRLYERVYGDAHGAPTVFDFEAATILKDTLLKPEETRVESFTFPTPTDAPSMDVILTVTYSPVHGPKEFLDQIEKEAPLGTKDRAFQAVEVLQKKKNIPLKKR